MSLRATVVAAVGLLAGLVVWLQAGSQPAATPGHEDTLSASRSVRFSYQLRVDDLSPTDQVEAWFPLPRTHAFQTVEAYALVEGHPAELVEDQEFGNRFLRLDLTSAAREAPDASLVATLEGTVTRRAYSAWERHGSQTARPRALDRYLTPDRLVPTDGFIADEARRVVGDVGDPLGKARRLYDHVVRTLSYGKTGEGWGRGDATYACDVRTGNCTDFHSLFIAEARAVGVPARFVIGFPLPSNRSEGTVPGYHCWSEFWLDRHGWVPVDASEAHKRPDRHEFFFGGLDADRVEFTIGRDLVLPGAAVTELNFLIYPHVEVNGQLHQAVETEFAFRSVPVSG